MPPSFELPMAFSDHEGHVTIAPLTRHIMRDIILNITSYDLQFISGTWEGRYMHAKAKKSKLQFFSLGLCLLAVLAMGCTKLDMQHAGIADGGNNETPGVADAGPETADVAPVPGMGVTVNHMNLVGVGQ